MGDFHIYQGIFKQVRFTFIDVYVLLGTFKKQSKKAMGVWIWGLTNDSVEVLLISVSNQFSLFLRSLQSIISYSRQAVWLHQ